MRIFFTVLIFLAIGAAWLNWRLWFKQHRRTHWHTSYLLLAVGSALLLLVTGIGQAYRWNFPAWLSMANQLAIFWLIAQFLLLLACVPGWLLRRERRRTALGPGRRQFLKWLGIGVPTLAFGTSAAGLAEATATLAVRQVPLRWENLPADLVGLRLVQISDVHLGPYVSLERLTEIIETARALQPDIVVITGDLIDDLRLLRGAVALLSRWAAEVPHGLFYCWGNHEYFRDISQIKAAIDASPLQLLDNSSRRLLIGATPLYMLGVDYPWGTANERQEKCQRFVKQVSREVPAEAFSILLAHHPDCFDAAFAAGIPLTLSGHTHGGQVAIAGYSLFSFGYRYLRGLYQAGASYGYVNVGAGHWLPFRLGCPPEITLLTLERS